MSHVGHTNPPVNLVVLERVVMSTSFVFLDPCQRNRFSVHAGGMLLIKIQNSTRPRES